MNKLLKAAIQEAEKSTYSHRVGAIIYYRDRIISRGHNYSQKSVRSITKKFIRWPGSIHAEVDAIINSKTDIKGMSLIVVRLNKQGELRMAKPCHWCNLYLDYVGLKRVYYSTNNGLEEL